MCQLVLSNDRESSGRPLSKDQIISRVDEFLIMPMFADIDRIRLIRELEVLFTSWSEAPRAIGDDVDHIPWLLQKKPDIEWKFWTRYELYLLKTLKLGPIAIENIRKATDEVLGRMEDPLRPGAWDRRGLVMGNVQSGKTGTYTGLICKAADAGYKVIIVLAGLHNNLRSQTQIRLDEGFLGYKAMPPGSGTGSFESTGVAQFGTGLKADSITNRHEHGDFNKAIADQFPMHPGGNPLLFVVKKNVSVLKNLLNWITHSADYTDPETKRKYHREIPLLVIDDEADQASVDTKTMAFDENGLPDEDHNPTITNAMIRRLLFAFDKSAYVGFTATPYANIFIHERARTKELGEDLFPRSFIVNLPAPDYYTGASKIFGIQEDGDAGLDEVKPYPIIRNVADHAKSERSDETEGWMPPKLKNKTDHIPFYEGQRIIPPSLSEALKAFLISTAVRKLRESEPQFNSMLIHVTRFKKIQSIVTEQVQEELSSIGRRLLNGDGIRKPSLVDELKNLWEDDFVPTSREIGPKYLLPEWKNVLEQIKRIVESIQIREINGSAGDVLDYEQHKSVGLTLIAIGGDKLSRGLTLEGLTVSYFLRSSKMYDTLMQMGRWFGYRDKYVDVCRLYTSAELSDWFQFIARATEELRGEFDYMVEVGDTPIEYGLKVRSHPALLVTSAVKMKSGTEMQLSYSGDISETIIFDRAKSTINNNFTAVKDLIEKMGLPVGGRTGGYLWRGVTSENIVSFLSIYQSHPEARRADARLLNLYIKKQVEHGELTDWSVFFASSGLDKAADVSEYFDGMAVGAIERARDSSFFDEEKYVIKRLVNPTDESRDLISDEPQIALDETIRLWAKSKRINKSPNPPEKMSGQGIRFGRSKHRGMLMIYPLDALQAGFSPDHMPIIGIAISFPKSETAKEISYTVNNVFTTSGDYDNF